jgi:UDP-sugar transporter A1/2/3
VVLVTELAKAALCACSLLLQRSPAGDMRRPAAWDVLQTAAPAACYLVQNLALQRAYADLDSLTFNCLNQTKLAATALFLYVLLGQRQSAQQLVALALLLFAGLLLQITGEQRAASSAGSAVKNFRRGVAVCSTGHPGSPLGCANSFPRAQACLLASALSGLASTLSQISLQASLRCNL